MKRLRGLIVGATVIALIGLALVLLFGEDEQGCALDLGALEAPGCTTLASDTAAVASPIPLWRRIECVSERRQQRPATGGDAAPTATRAPQGNDAYRRITVLDGDNFDGERCELGRNELTDTFQVYGEGERRITFISYRIPLNLVLEDDVQQAVMQMKQAEPSDFEGGTPMLSLHARDGGWELWRSDTNGEISRSSEIWSTPAEERIWTRIALDVTYSQDPAIGRITLYIDANGDGDAIDGGEQSPTFETSTLKVEPEGSDDDGLSAGDSIPSHLRVGLYHEPEAPCPAPSGCSVEIDNVQVIDPVADG